MVEIYINSQLIDLYDEEEIVVSFAVNNLFDIESRDGTYSNTFKIPATHNNNNIFGQFNNILSTTNNAFEVLNALIYVDDVLQVNGFAQMTSANLNEYEIRIFSGNTDWAQAIANINLKDVLPASLNHNWDVNEVVASRYKTFIDGYNYPNIDYGNLFFAPSTPPFEAPYYELYPAIYCKYLFERIFQIAGYTIESDWFNNNGLFAKQIIPFSADWKRNRDYTLRNFFTNSIPVDTPLTVGMAYYYYPQFTQIDSYPTNGWQGYNINNGTTTVLDGGIIELTYNLEFFNPHPVPCSFTIDLIYTDDNGNQIFLPFASFTTPPLFIVPALGVATFNTTVTINVSQTSLVLRIGVNTLDGVILRSGSYVQLNNFTPTVEDENDLLISSDFPFITLGSTLPDISATDFIMTIANQYGLIFDQDNYEKRVKIFEFDSVIKNIPNALDWSNKLDLSEYPVITNLHNEYFRNNYFKYAKDSNDTYLTLQDGFADWSLVVDFANADTQQDLFTSEFAPVIRIESFANGIAGTGVLEMAYIPVYESGVFQQVTPRMAYIEFDNTTPITIPTFSGGYNPAIQPNVYFEELRFINLINTYYAQYSNLLNNSKAVNCLIRINNIDINTLDFRKPVWIDYFGAYFYINEIQQYKVTSKDSTQITLILINN
jgi:hypothetical protein